VIALPNPYSYGGPIEGAEGFHNRASEITRIASRIAAERPQSVSVVGSGRSGKSSLINYLLDPAVQPDYLDDPAQYLLLRLRFAYDPPRDVEGFFKCLGAALEYLGEAPMEPTYDGFSKVVKAAMQARRRMVIFLDDFGNVTRHDGFSLEFYSYMRSVANSNDVGYLTTSWAPLQQLCHTQDIEESPFFNIFTTVSLDPFKEEEARKLVETPAAAAGVSLADAVDDILSLAGGSPYLLQLAASVAFEARDGGGLTRSQLAAAMLDRATDFLQWWWRNVPEAQREVMRRVASGKPVDRRHEYAAESLTGRGVLQQEDGGYGFRIGLMGEYVRTRQRGGLLKRLFR